MVSENGVKMGTATSYSSTSAIDTPHFRGPNYLGTFNDFSAGNPGKASFGFTFAPSFAFHNPSSAKTWGALMDHQVHLAELGGGYYVFNSSNKVSAFHESDWAKYGFVHNPDESADRMDGWINSTVGSHAIEHVSIPVFRGIIAGRHEHMVDPTLGKYVTYLEYEGPLNDLGKNLSRTANLRQDWVKYLASKEGQALAHEHHGTDSIDFLAVLPDSGIYAIARNRDGKIVLIADVHSYEKLNHDADAFGIPLQDMRIRGLGEEALHHYRNSYDMAGTLGGLIEEEIATKAELWAFYRELAENSASKPDLRAKYERIAKSLEVDIATVEPRYTQWWRQAHGNGHLSDLELSLISEAYARGLETDSEVSNYVSGRMAALKSEKPTENSGKAAGNNPDSRSKGHGGKSVNIDKDGAAYTASHSDGDSNEGQQSDADSNGQETSEGSAADSASGSE